jgi:hypothetical protein
MMPVNYARYCRCSDDDQAHGDFSTIDAQDATTLRYVMEAGGRDAGRYADEGVSGTRESRPGMNALLSDASAKKFSVVVVTFMSRLGRGDCFVHLERELKKRGVRVEMVKERFSDDAAGFIAKKATNLMDGLYPVMVSGWVKSKQAEMVAAGHYCGTRLPFGLKTEGGEGAPRKVVADPDTIAIVEKAYRLYAATGSLSSTRDYLMSAAPGSRQWHFVTVRRLLSGELFRGVLRFGKRVNRNAFAAILPPDLTESVDARLMGRELEMPLRSERRPEGKTDTHTYYLRSVLYCGACSCRMTPKHATGSKGIVPYYQCTNLRSGKDCFGAKRINAHRIHAGILSEIARCGASPSRIERACQAAAKRMPGPEAEQARAIHLRKEIKRIDTALLRITRAIAGGAGVAAFVTEARRLETERAGMVKDAMEAEAAALMASGRRPDAKQIAADWSRFAEAWEFLNETERTRLMLLLVEKAEMVEKDSAVVLLRMDNGGDLRGMFDSDSRKAPLSSLKANVFPSQITLTIPLPSARRVTP